MVDVLTLCPGDRIRIVDKWPANGKHNKEGYMDKYLGQILTVREVDADGCCYTLEDMGDRGGRGWSWFPNLIAEAIVEDFEPADISALMDFLGI